MNKAQRERQERLELVGKTVKFEVSEYSPLRNKNVGMDVMLIGKVVRWEDLPFQVYTIQVDDHPLPYSVHPRFIKEVLE